VQGSIDRLTDWMELQAGYVCGALLMPQWRVELLAGAFGLERGASLPLKLESIDAQALTKLLDRSVRRFARGGAGETAEAGASGRLKREGGVTLMVNS